ncbi:hypothetical protein [Streptomyces sp. CA-106131]
MRFVHRATFTADRLVHGVRRRLRTRRTAHGIPHQAYRKPVPATKSSQAS